MMNRPLVLDLSPSEAKIVVMDVLAALSGSGSLATGNGTVEESALIQARANAGSDMLRQMQTVFPLAVQVEAQVLAEHGLLDGMSGPGEAVVQFHALLQAIAPQDPEIEALLKQLRMRLISCSP